MSQNINAPFVNPLLGQPFQSFDAARKALDDLGTEVGFNMRIRESRPKGQGATYVLLECASRNCRYRVILSSVNQGWTIKPVNGSGRDCHNHAFVDVSNSPRYRQSLLAPKKEEIIRMWNSGSRSSHIRSSLTAQDAKFACVTVQDIFNILNVHRQSEPRPIDWLATELDNHMGLWHRIRKSSGYATDLFIVPTTSIELVRQHSNALTIDCTRKSNRFATPIFSICGRTSHHISFNIAICFLTKECDFAWAIDCLAQLYQQYNIPLPQTLCTITESPLILALRECQTFKDVPHLLCRWHAKKTLVSMTPQWFPPSDSSKADFQMFLGSWDKLVLSQSEREFEENCAAFRGTTHPAEAAEYVLATIGRWKENIVSCYINKHTHFGQTTTPIRDSHSDIKNHLYGRAGVNLKQVFDNLLSFWTHQPTRIKQQQENLKQKMGIYVSNNFFDFIRNSVSVKALKLLAEERRKLRCTMKSRTPLGPCMPCPIIKAYGLPCLHLMRSYHKSRTALPRSLIDQYWFLDGVSISDGHSLQNPLPVRGKGRPRGAVATQRPQKKARIDTGEQEPASAPSSVPQAVPPIPISVPHPHPLPHPLPVTHSAPHPISHSVPHSVPNLPTSTNVSLPREYSDSEDSDDDRDWPIATFEASDYWADPTFGFESELTSDSE